MKIKVNRLELIKALEAKIAELKKEEQSDLGRIKEEVDSYKSSAKTYQDRLKKNLTLLEKVNTRQDAIEATQKLQGVSNPYFSVPSETKTTKTIGKIKSILVRLKLSNEELLSTDDKEEYLQYL